MVAIPFRLPSAAFPGFALSSSVFLPLLAFSLRSVCSFGFLLCGSFGSRAFLVPSLWPLSLLPSVLLGSPCPLSFPVGSSVRSAFVHCGFALLGYFPRCFSLGSPPFAASSLFPCCFLSSLITAFLLSLLVFPPDAEAWLPLPVSRVFRPFYVPLFLRPLLLFFLAEFCPSVPFSHLFSHRLVFPASSVFSAGCRFLFGSPLRVLALLAWPLGFSAFLPFAVLPLLAFRFRVAPGLYFLHAPVLSAAGLPLLARVLACCLFFLAAYVLFVAPLRFAVGAPTLPCGSFPRCRCWFSVLLPGPAGGSSSLAFRSAVGWLVVPFCGFRSLLFFTAFPVWSVGFSPSCLALGFPAWLVLGWLLALRLFRLSFVPVVPRLRLMLLLSCFAGVSAPPRTFRLALGCNTFPRPCALGGFSFRTSLWAFFF